MTSCIFCRIIAGDIPAHVVYETKDVVAFLDITQVTEGHTLLIPKKHVCDVFEWDAATATAIAQAIPIVANLLQRSFPNMLGLNIVNNNRETAYQTVFHSHVHLIPRYSAADGFSMIFPSQQDAYGNERLAAIAENIRAHHSESEA